MRVQHILNKFRYAKSSNIIAGGFFVMALMLTGVGTFQFNQTQAQAASACNSQTNNIVPGGTNSYADVTRNYNANTCGDLQAIYNHYWIKPTLAAGDRVYDGTSNNRGEVIADGRVVAKNAASVGRQAIKYSSPISINGQRYYQTSHVNGQAFADPSSSLATLVVLDAKGNFKYAIIKACGNPIYATPVAPPTPPTPPQPAYSCTALTMMSLSTTKKRFTATASASNGAQVVGYVFDFGDGKTQDSTSATADHEYAGPGTYSAKVSAKISVSGATKLVDGPNCVAQVEIKPSAAVDCTALNVLSKGNNTYDFTIVETHTNATYKGAKLDFGDGNSTTITGTTASHQFAKAGNYTITATLSFDVDGQVKNATCTAKVTMEVCPTNPNLPKDSPDCAVCPTNPNLPKDSPDCVPCPYDNTLPKDSPNCKAPQTPVAELPQTGAGDMILNGLGISSLIVSASIYIGSRRDLLTALLNR